MVCPRRLVWSSPRLVTPVTTGLSMMLVQSYSPPIPTSMMATSTASAQKMLKARMVRNLK